MLIEVRHFGYLPKLRTVLHQFDPSVAQEDIIYLLAVKALTGSKVTAVFWMAIQHTLVGGYEHFERTVTFIFTVEDTSLPYFR
jgi:hypothetical protein